MASITAISRCAGQTHIHMTIDTSLGVKNLTYDLGRLTKPPKLSDDDYQIERLGLLVREAQAAGNTTYAQIRTYLLNRDFVE